MRILTGIIIKKINYNNQLKMITNITVIELKNNKNFDKSHLKNNFQNHHH